MEQINNRKFQVTAHDLITIGVELERVLGRIEEKEYGVYKLEPMELQTKIALKIADGMCDWQQQHNKGLNVRGDNHITLEIYDLHELQKRMDEAIDQADY